MKLDKHAEENKKRTYQESNRRRVEPDREWTVRTVQFLIWPKIEPILLLVEKLNIPPKKKCEKTTNNRVFQTSKA